MRGLRQLFYVNLLAVGISSASITNECMVSHMDGTTGPCDVAKAEYGYFGWGAEITTEDNYAKANQGFSQMLTFTGPASGSQGYIGIYAYDFFHHDSISGGSFGFAAESNLPMLRTLDDTLCMECQGIDLPLVPITFGTPLVFSVWEEASAQGHEEGTQGVGGVFRVLQINVYDHQHNLLAELERPQAENVTIDVPAHAPEPATLGITGAAGLAFLLARSRRRKTMRD